MNGPQSKSGPRDADTILISDSHSMSRFTLTFALSHIDPRKLLRLRLSRGRRDEIPRLARRERLPQAPRVQLLEAEAVEVLGRELVAVGGRFDAVVLQRAGELLEPRGLEELVEGLRGAVQLQLLVWLRQRRQLRRRRRRRRLYMYWRLLHQLLLHWLLLLHRLLLHWLLLLHQLLLHWLLLLHRLLLHWLLHQLLLHLCCRRRNYIERLSRGRIYAHLPDLGVTEVSPLSAPIAPFALILHAAKPEAAQSAKADNAQNGVGIIDVRAVVVLVYEVLKSLRFARSAAALALVVDDAGVHRRARHLVLVPALFDTEAQYPHRDTCDERAACSVACSVACSEFG